MSCEYMTLSNLRCGLVMVTIVIQFSFGQISIESVLHSYANQYSPAIIEQPITKLSHILMVVYFGFQIQIPIIYAMHLNAFSLHTFGTTGVTI